MDLTCYMGENVAGIGYRFFDGTGPLGVARITTGIDNPVAGTYLAAGVSPPAGAKGVRWSDTTDLKEAVELFSDWRPIGDGSPFETAREALAARFTELWDTDALFPVVLENQPIPDRAEKWGTLNILQGDGSEREIGTDNDRRVGVLILCVFILHGKGTKAGTDAADWMRNNFGSRQIRRGNVIVTLRQAGMVDAGPRNGYVQKNIRVPFQTDCYQHPVT